MLSMAGYSGTPLIKKLGIRSGMSVYVYQPPDYYWNLLLPLPDPRPAAAGDAVRLSLAGAGRRPGERGPPRLPRHQALRGAPEGAGEIRWPGTLESAINPIR